MASTAADDYVLRSRDAEEIARLEHQHEIWRPDTERALRAAGFGPGDRLLDVGSGPGFLTLDLARTVGETGSVVSIDTSERFIRHLRHESERSGLGWIEPRVGDATEMALPRGSFDGAVCRWVLMFVSEPQRVVEAVASALRPGAALVVMEYMSFRSISMWPPSPPFTRVYEAVYELIVDAGGDPDIGGTVPCLLEQAGFEIVELIPVLRVGRPGSPLWQWLEAVSPNHHQLLDAGLLSPSELEAYHRDWQARSEASGTFINAPPLLATVAVR